MTNDHPLQRMLTNSGTAKYPTIGKFLPSSIKQTNLYSAPDVVSAPAPVPDVVQNVATTPSPDSVPDADLDLLDRLVGQTILDRSLASSSAQDVVVSSGRAKETLSPLIQADQAEVSPQPEASIAQDEVEKPAENVVTPEMVELSNELKEVSSETKEQREKAEIAKKQQEINNLAAESTTPVAVSAKPVVVLPITAKSKEEAKFKSTKYSVKWLIEWCGKIAKIFSGAVIYKEEVENE